MSDITTATRFDEHALAELPEAAGFTGDLRLRALREFEAMPIPSQETEEWRYTDLSDFALDFVPFSPGGGPEAVNRHGVLEAARVAGERAGLQIQRNSEVISTHLVAGLADQGVVFGDLDVAAATHPDLVEPHLHSLVPTSRTKFLALHGAFRTAGTFLYVPDGLEIELPLQTLTYLDADGAAVFPHTLIVVGTNASVTFIDRYVSPDLTRAFSDAVTEIVVGDGARVRYASIQDWGKGVTHLGVQRARVGRDADIRTLALGFGADLSRAEAETVLAEPGGFSEMLGVFFADGEQHFDHRTLQDHVAPNCQQRPAVQGGAPRLQPRRLQRLGARAAGPRRRRTRCRRAATSCSPSMRRPMRSPTWRSRRTTSGAVMRRAWGRSTRRPSSTSRAAASCARTPSG